MPLALMPKFMLQMTDENTILNLKMQKAKIDVWGVGNESDTCSDQPALGAVYKIVSTKMDQTRMIPSNCPTMLRRFPTIVRAKSL